MLKVSGGCSYGCTNLITVPNFNIIKVESLYETFANCYNLTSVPDFNTEKVTNMAFTFSNCRNLIDVPNFNLHNTRDTQCMFYGCTNLVNIPLLDMNKATWIGSMFRECPNLSGNSIANITNMLPNASQLSNKYVVDIGLNLSRFTNEQLRILNAKGYVDAIAPELTVQNYYEIQWE